MAIATDFSVTAMAGRPISNPVAPIDNPAVLPAESVTSIAGPDFIPPLAAGEINAPDVISAEDIVVIDAPTVVVPEDVADIDTPDTIPAETATTASAPTVITPNAATLTEPPFPLNHARILYDNVLLSSSAFSDVTGSTPGYSRIPNTYQRFNSTGGNCYLAYTVAANADVDTICIGSHNLGGKGYTVIPYYRETSGGALNAFAGGKVPETDDAIMFHRSTSVSVYTIEIYFSGGTDSFYIGYVSAGIALQMQRPFFSGHTPITDSQVTEYYDSRTETGDSIGRAIRLLGQKTSYSWNNINDTWYRTYFEPFKQSAKTMPFFIAWNLLEYPLDVGMCVVTEDISAPYSGSRTLRSISFTVEGIL